MTTHRKRSGLRRKKSHEKQSQVSGHISAIASQMDASDVGQIVERVSDPDEACALIEAIPAGYAGTEALVSALAEKFCDKSVMKSARRLAFKLKNAGIEVETLNAASVGDSLLKKERFSDELSASMGPVMDIAGTRAVLFTSHSPVKGIHAGIGMVSPTEGIREFVFGPLPKKLLGSMVQEVDSAAGPLVEVDLSLFFTIMEAACTAGSQGTPSALAYKEMRPFLLNRVQGYEGPIHADLRDESRQRKDILTSSEAEELFSNAPLNMWIPADYAVASYMDKLNEVRQSPLTLSNALLRDREREIEDKLALEIFTPDRRNSIADILYETAYFHRKRGEDRLKRLALSAAREMDEGEGGMSNPAIRLLVSRVLESNADETDADMELEENTESGLILAP
ncbi:MAG: hypothetical protein COX16_16055 [Deltaproteobacteria bacterium CG23_combo_of_CG06-09_8_20_14_all_51_20]|nr:hypothetical protein [bacterium]OIP40404.1 MAG: hypothetical protein AUK25_07670 [Desulfobacteraceae bacterium CG2_30_51_40]PIP44902.1 MAG: hypothetical protein COX16_16055 [Deltaproteobacteria bacterium CG23_combo_of_CG06-09_8_20_14_all_51_20]PIV99264.1 MAG: hypothetical protein COW41_08435 [Deltaproteobacteria bacterium CG17_big_fil_post_rev_8_21_14_2_50_51_6]PIY26904.1 MAG: hypothetical protein COZ11_01500 [Deltaproteobacteria bacterium CG_4_10_14_3_um_filter_51_14]PJB35309.1 MAG: hypoth